MVRGSGGVPAAVPSVTTYYQVNNRNRFLSDCLEGDATSKARLLTRAVWNPCSVSLMTCYITRNFSEAYLLKSDG
jgi:hypothetical protein